MLKSLFISLLSLILVKIGFSIYYSTSQIPQWKKLKNQIVLQFASLTKAISYSWGIFSPFMIFRDKLTKFYDFTIKEGINLEVLIWS